MQLLVYIWTYKVPVGQVFEFPSVSPIGKHCLCFIGDDVLAIIDISRCMGYKQYRMITQDRPKLHGQLHTVLP